MLEPVYLEEKVDYQSYRGGVQGQEEILGWQDGMVKNERVQVGKLAF